MGAILSAEQKEPPDWEEVERLTDALLQQLVAEPNSECPEIVNHYLDDIDIRSGDEAYGAQQRERVSRFVATGEYKDSTPVPWWICAIVLAVLIAGAVWLLW